MDLSPTYLDPKNLSDLKDLRLRTNQIVDGLVNGMHRSPFQGHSVEFAQHREYVAGDDTRYVDWKVFARTDKLHLKQFENETNFCCWLLIDQSESMSYRGPQEPLSKFEFASCFAVTMAWLVLNQRDAIAMATFGESVASLIRPSDQKANLFQIVEQLSRTELIGKTSLSSSLQEVAVEAQHRGIVLVLTDCFDDFESIAGGIETLKKRGHQVKLLQVLDRSELQFDFSMPLKMRGLESGAEFSVDPVMLRKAYLDVVKKSRDQLVHYCQSHDVDFFQFRSDMNIATAIRWVIRGRLATERQYELG